MTSPDREWITTWLDRVVSGESTMSQRKVTSIDAHGGLEAIVAEARKRGVHLLRLEDDEGNDLVAASLKPFEVLC